MISKWFFLAQTLSFASLVYGTYRAQIMKEQLRTLKQQIVCSIVRQKQVNGLVTQLIKTLSTLIEQSRATLEDQEHNNQEVIFDRPSE